MGVKVGPFQVRKVAVIGAGPAGLSAAKYLKAQGSFDSITVFEQQDEVGGIWKYSDLAPGPYPAPQADPFFAPDTPIEEDGRAIFPSAMYSKLHSNIPKQLMQFGDQEFEDDDWAYPSREAVQRYLVKYSQGVRDIIKFEYQVTNIKHSLKGVKDEWNLEAQSVTSKEGFSDKYDAVVVANGHYAIPFTPNIKGLSEFQAAHPGVIIHSKQYRAASAYQDKKVVVVGNGPSGSDIALQINQVSKGKTLLSVKKPTPPERLQHIGAEEFAEINEFITENRTLRFKDGREVTDVDAVVFCTGFVFSYPFLPDLQRDLITTGRGVHGLYKHLFNIRYPTLVFPALNMNAVPWPLSEGQAAVFSAVWSNKLSLPLVEDMEKWSRELYENKGEALHAFGQGPGDGEYINEMHDWATKASHLGKVPPRWSDELFWQRSIFISAKIVFEKAGCKAKNLEELGLQYDPNWREKN